MTPAVAFENVDILFGARRRAVAARAWRCSTRAAAAAEIQKQTGVVVGVAGASIAVAQGEICVLMGLSGSGKSTLMRAANGLTPVTRGQVWVAHGDGAGGRGRLRRLRPCGGSGASGSPWCSSNSPCCPGGRCARTSPSAWSCAA